ncbi:MAG: DUF333 domain-containing protein [Anaerolineae bacterium]
MNKRIFVAVVVLAIAALALGTGTGYAQFSRPSGPTQGTVQNGVYTNPVAGYSLTLPASWLSHGYKWYEYYGADAEKARPGTTYITEWVYTPQEAGQPEGVILAIYNYPKAYWDDLASQPVALPGPLIAETADTAYVMFGPGGVPYPDGSVDRVTYDSLAMTPDQVRQAFSAVGAVPPTPFAPPQAAPAAPDTGGAAIANPASQNCVKQGGTLSIETKPDGGQYGVCIFEDNRQCEEWALLRGECPAGGVKVTGLVTPAARYCVITGGQYTVTGASNTPEEQGTCTLKSGQQCDVWDYYNGKCTQTSTPAPSAPGSVFPAPTAPATGPTLGGARQVSFDSNRGGDYDDIYLMGVAGTDTQRLTTGDANSFAGPWSPDGAKMAYTSFGLTNSDVSVMNADGSGQTNLTHEASSSSAGFPSWSPDGRRIAFTSRRDGNNEIYVMQADGSNPTRLTNNPADDFAAAWSPDGSRIVFASDRDRTAGVYSLYIMNADGSGVTRLTNAPTNDYAPAWSPDGARIAFHAFNNGPADVYVINTDGTELRNLTQNPAQDWFPAWSPDGTHIAFQTNRDGNWEIYAMTVPPQGANADAIGTDLTNLTKNSADDQRPAWRQ